MHKNILLIGARGCGKTTLGRRLAERLHRPFVDLDERALAILAQSSVREVWAKLGESAWRQAEVDVLREALRSQEQIIALGGGTPMIPEARQIIEADAQDARSLVVYLRCSAQALANRLQQQLGDRPSLTGKKPAYEVQDVLTAREPTYRTLADFECDTDRLSVDAALSKLLKWLSQHGG